MSDLVYSPEDDLSYADINLIMDDIASSTRPRWTITLVQNFYKKRLEVILGVLVIVHYIHYASRAFSQHKSIQFYQLYYPHTFCTKAHVTP